MTFRTLAPVSVLSLAACDGTLLTIELDYESTVQVEQGTVLETLVGGMGFGDFLNMDITDSTELENQGVGPGDINSVRITHFELEATEPANGDLSFLESLDLVVGGPDLPDQVVASQSDFPEGQALVVMNLMDVDLVDYAVSESMDLTTEVSGRRPEQDTSVRAYVIFDVEVTAQGARNYNQ